MDGLEGRRNYLLAWMKPTTWILGRVGSMREMVRAIPCMPIMTLRLSLVHLVESVVVKHLATSNRPNSRCRGSALSWMMPSKSELLFDSSMSVFEWDATALSDHDGSSFLGRGLNDMARVEKGKSVPTDAASSTGRRKSSSRPGWTRAKSRTSLRSVPANVGHRRSVEAEP